ncbi:hypothetical protein TH24_12475 [Thalassospira xiamenensis]|nr:hypothetical protein TH24_12475 [Thalassospira xiamenensis]
MAAVAAVICGPSVVDRLGSAHARRPAAGENNSGPRCVWMSAWQVAAVAGASNEPVGGPWGISWRGCWRPEVCPAPVVMALAKGGGAGSEVVGGPWGVSWRDCWRSEVCPALVVMALAKGGGAGSEVVGGPWGVSWRDCWRSEVCPASVVMALAKMAGVGSEVVGRRWAVSGPSGGGADGGPRFVEGCWKFRIASRRGGFAGRGSRGSIGS